MVEYLIVELTAKTGPKTQGMRKTKKTMRNLNANELTLVSGGIAPLSGPPAPPQFPSPIPPGFTSVGQYINWLLTGNMNEFQSSNALN